MGKRTLGVDYGERRFGFAVSDPDGVIALPLRVVPVKDEEDALRQVAAQREETGADAVVIGLPLNMDGSLSRGARNVLAFAEKLKARLTVPVHTWDERLSSRMVERMMIEADASRARRKKALDKLAAQVILQGYLDYQTRT
jgi:putative Holliday junction resolvase